MILRWLRGWRRPGLDGTFAYSAKAPAGGSGVIGWRYRSRVFAAGAPIFAWRGLGGPSLFVRLTNVAGRFPRLSKISGRF